jgi:hypothetical protein
MDWVKHGAGEHQLFPAQADLQDDAGDTLITTYAVKRPDGLWSLLLVNKDPSNSHEVKIEFDVDGKSTAAQPAGEWKMVTFGAAEYVWHPEGADSHADPAGPAKKTTVSFKSNQAVLVPKASIVVLTGKVADQP